MQLRLFQPPDRRSLRPALFDDNEKLVESVSQYLSRLSESAKGYSPKTIDRYGRQIRYFCEFVRSLEFYANQPMDDVLAAIPGGYIDQYLRQLQREGKADSTIRHRDVVLKGFFEWLTTAEAGRLREDSGYTSGLKTRATKRKMPRFVTKEQLIHLLQGFHHESQRCAVHFLWDTGLRVSELPRVTQTDIANLNSWPDGTPYMPLRVSGVKAHNAAGIKERYTLMSRAMFERVSRYHQTLKYRKTRLRPSPAFLNTKGEPMTARAIQKAIQDAAGRVGIPRGTISAHRLRHGTALSILKGESGADYLEKMVLIQTQFGHSSIKSTEVYASIPPSLFSHINSDAKIAARFEEAQEVYERTYLAAKNRREHRGRPRRA